MLIRFERTGGFAGLRIEASLDTDLLPPEEARKLHELVEAAGFFGLPEKFPLPKKGADYFQYRLSVEKEGKKHAVELSEPSVSAALRPLLGLLMKYAKK